MAENNIYSLRCAKAQLAQKTKELSEKGYELEIIPTLDYKYSRDMWIIMSKNEIHITHKISLDVYDDDKSLYHCLNVMEKEHQKWSDCMVNKDGKH